MAAGILFLRLATLAILTLLASFLSRELMRQMGAQREARRTSERWASLLSTIAAAARAMPLDRDRIIDATLLTAVDLGLDGADLSETGRSGKDYRVVAGRGVPHELVGQVFPLSAGITGRVLATGRTVVLEDYATDDHAIPMVRERGFHAGVAAPMWIHGRLSAVLAGGTRVRRRLEPVEVQAFELLAGQAALALENADRYAQERDAVERLREVDAMKSDFLATVSHELRTPVTVIQGAGKTLERAWDAVDDETRRQLLAGLNSNAEALHAILTTLLDFSRVERGTVDMLSTPLDITELLERTAMRLAGLFAGRRLSTDIAPRLAAEGDAILLGRTLDNLLPNAVKHTPPGTTVVLSGRREGDQVVVAVSDDGPGIPAGELARLGERFFRGGELNKRPRGLGLGLALVREMLELHGSRLEIESRTGAGSTFTFRLPAIELRHEEASDAGGPRAAAEGIERAEARTASLP